MKPGRKTARLAPRGSFSIVPRSLAGARFGRSAGSTRPARCAPGHLSHKGSTDMPLYENVFIARQDISGAQVDTLADGFTQLIAEDAGEIKKREHWGLRNLAYRMKKNRNGHYVLVNIDEPDPVIAERDRNVRNDEPGP